MIYALIFISALSFSSPAKMVSFQGTVLDFYTKMPVKNAVLRIDGSQKEVFSDEDGKFKISGKSTAKLSISHIAYEYKEVALNSNEPELLIELTPEFYELTKLNEIPQNLVFPKKYDSLKFSNQYVSRSNANSLTFPPEFPGGESFFQGYLVNGIFENFESLEESFQASFYFHVDENGTVHLDSLINGPEDDVFFRELITKSPKWVPAFQKSEPVTTYFHQELTFDRSHDLWFTVEVQPEYPGGMGGFYMRIAENLDYPKLAKKKRVEGKVFVSFVVNQTGELEDVAVVRGIGYDCDEEAMRVVRMTSGEWMPGTQRGRPVKVRMILPITFKL